jgi:hypothetical protein
MKQLHLQVYSLLEDVEYIKVGFGGHDEDELCGKGFWACHMHLLNMCLEHEEASGAADSTCRSIKYVSRSDGFA